MCIFLSFGLFMLLCVSAGHTQYIFHTPMAQYSLYVLKVPLNQINKQTIVVKDKVEDPGQLGVSKSSECDTLLIECSDTGGLATGRTSGPPVTSWVLLCWSLFLACNSRLHSAVRRPHPHRDCLLRM